MQKKTIYYSVDIENIVSTLEAKHNKRLDDKAQLEMEMEKRKEALTPPLIQLLHGLAEIHNTCLRLKLLKSDHSYYGGWFMYMKGNPIVDMDEFLGRMFNKPNGHVSLSETNISGMIRELYHTQVVIRDKFNYIGGVDAAKNSGETPYVFQLKLSSGYGDGVWETHQTADELLMAIVEKIINPLATHKY